MKHSRETCTMCRKQSGMVCYIKKYDRNLECLKANFILVAITKYGLNRSLVANNKKEWSHVNLPFQLGEVSGKYLDYLDKLLSYLQTLLSTLILQFPEQENLGSLLEHITSYRGVHWAMALVYGHKAERIERTAVFFQMTMFKETTTALTLKDAIEEVESQDGVSAWNTFLFLYEMMGLYTRTLLFSTLDVNTFNQKDRDMANKEYRWDVVIQDIIRPPRVWLNRGIMLYKLRNDSFVSHMKGLLERFESLEIFDDKFRLKKFTNIYQHFSPAFKDNQEIEVYSCEVCQRDVFSKDTKYVYHNFHPHCEPWFGTDEARSKKHSVYNVLTKADIHLNLENIILYNHNQQIEDGKPYITFAMGMGLKVICNEGECAHIYDSHIFKYRGVLSANFLGLLTRYRQEFRNLQCWTCKMYSKESHRCRSCKSRLYCSKECQTKDWKVHETICKELKEVGDQVKSDSYERKENGRIKVEEDYKHYIRGHEDCGDNCSGCHQVKNMYDKLGGKAHTKPSTDTDTEVD